MWTFYDFMDGGQNVIEAWVAGHGASVRAELDARLETLRVMKPPWEFPLSRPMRGAPWKGLREIRFKSDNVQFRVLYADGPGRFSVTLLFGFDKNTRLDTALAKRIQARRDKIDDDGSVTPHFSSGILGPSNVGQGVP